MTFYFVKQLTIAGGTAPSDTNDGKDPIGFNLSNATYDHTGGTVERMLTLSAAFTSYVFNAGDRIFLTGAPVGGVADDTLYTITSRVGNDAIGLAADAGLTADSTADVDSSTGPWLTGQHSLTIWTADDTVHWCADQVWTGQNRVKFSDAARAGTMAAPKLLTGATGRGVVDGTRIFMTGNDIVGVLSDEGIGSCLGHTTLQYMDLTQLNSESTADTIRITAGHKQLRFVDLACHGAKRAGITIDSTLSHVQFLRVEMSNNDGHGLGIGSVHDSSSYIDHSSFHDNGKIGVYMGRMDIRNSLIYNNTLEGLRILMSNATGFFFVNNCVVYGNGSDGIYIGVADNSLVGLKFTNNILMNNGGYAINFDANASDTALCAANSIVGNTAGATSRDGVTDLGVTGVDFNALTPSIGTDPNFVSVVDGSEDFTPERQSVLFSSGELGGIPEGAVNRQTYIGAIPPDLTAGGDGIGGGGHMIGG